MMDPLCCRRLLSILIFIHQVSFGTQNDPRQILSYIDLEGEKSYKYIYSSLLQKSPVKDKVMESDVPVTSAPGEEDINARQLLLLTKPERHVVWPQGTVPYLIDYNSYREDEKVKTVLEQAMNIWSNVTCVKFWNIADPQYSGWREALGHRRYVKILHTPFCGSVIGFQHDTAGSTEFQRLSLHEQGCMFVGIVLHELGHLLGLVHEHSRSDRDGHIMINKQNIKSKYSHNFNPLDTLNNISSFDYNSIMHYGLKDFTSNNKETISLADSNLNFLAGQREALTFYDIKAINKAYQCTAHCTTSIACKNDGYIGPDCECICPSVLGGNDCNGIDDEWNSTECKSSVHTLSAHDSIEITSPSHPSSYGSKNCAWLIKGPSNEKLTISLSMNDIPRNKHTHKCYHSVEIRYSLPGQQGISFCGFTTFPYHIESLGDTVLVILHGDDTRYAGKNFKIRVGSGELGSACVSNPCTGIGKTCVDGTGAKDYTCECMENFVGPDCSAIDWITCSFDWKEGPLPLCLFTQNKEDKLDWVKSSKPTSSRRTGPTSGVGGDGSYLYVESSSPARTGDTAYLDSLPISAGTKCVSFYYHMYGDTMGELYVIMTSETNPEWTQHWVKAGDHGDEWKHVLISVNSETNFRIHVKAVRGTGHRSDMAIDSVSITTGLCPAAVSNSAVHTFNISPLSESSCPLFYTGDNCDEIYEAFCNFDDDDDDDDNNWCIFKNEGESYYSWRKHKGSTPTDHTGPNSDVSGDKYYLYTEASDPATPDDKANLVSDFIQGGKVCVQFKLYMYGSHMGSVIVKFEDVSGHVYITERDKEMGNAWCPERFNVNSNEKFKITIQSVRGYRFRSDIAMDDFHLSRGHCLDAANEAKLQ